MFPQDEILEAEKVRNKDYTYYEEDIYVGYRHNVGDFAGKEVVQVYAEKLDSAINSPL